MLYRLLKFDETSKSSASKVAILNLLTTFFLTVLLISFVYLFFHYYDDVTATHVAPLLWVEVVLNFLFFPFAFVLVFGIKKEKHKWIRVWIKAKVVQASYLFLLNFVIQVYITASFNFADGLVVLGYTLIIEGYYMETIVFMNNYYLYNVPDEDSNELPKCKAENPIEKV